MEKVERTEPGEEIGDEQGKGRRRRKVNREDRESGCGFLQGREEKRWEKIQKWKRMWGVKTWERESSTQLRSVRCGVDLDLKLYSPSLSLRLHLCSNSRTPSSPPAIPSTTRNPSLPLPPTPSFPRSFHPRRRGSMSGRQGQEEGFGGS